MSEIDAAHSLYDAVVYTDGCAKGYNGRGAASSAFIAYRGEKIVHEYAYAHLHPRTNNYAEYFALILAMRWAIRNKLKAVLVRSDSELLVRQMTGQYGVHNEDLLVLWRNARGMKANIPVFHIEWVRGHSGNEANERVDELANQVLNEPKGCIDNKYE